MKKSAYYYFVFVLIVMVILVFPGRAPAKRGDNKIKNYTLLENIEQLVDISQDLDLETTVYLKPEEKCFCSCRNNYWSCTDLECGEQNRECRNFLRTGPKKEENTYRH